MVWLKNGVEAIESHNKPRNKIKNLIKSFKDRLLNNFKNTEKDNKKEKIEWIKTFSQWEEMYNKMLNLWRCATAISALKTMCEKASTQWEQLKLKWYLLSAMLMWIIKNNANAKTIKSIWDTTKGIWFWPLSWLTDVNQSEKVLNLLNWISEQDNRIKKVSEAVDSNVRDYDYSKSWIRCDYWKFNSKFQKYWEENWENILKHISNIKNRWENNKKM